MFVFLYCVQFMDYFNMYMKKVFQKLKVFDFIMEFVFWQIEVMYGVNVCNQLNIRKFK